MDPMTLIITALTASAGVAGTALVSEAVKDGYEKLKKSLLERFGRKCDVEASLTMMEKAPESDDLRRLLQGELDRGGAEKDHEVVELARGLYDSLIKAGVITIEVKGPIAKDSSAAVKGDGSIASVNKVEIEHFSGVLQTGFKAKAQFVTEQGLPRIDRDKALRKYFIYLQKSNRHLNLQGIELEESDSGSIRKRMDLAGVYIALDTMTHDETIAKKETKTRDMEVAFRLHPKNVSALEAVIRNHHTMLLGNPGSGKTTFLNHLSLCLAAHNANPDAGWLDGLEGWPQEEADIIPLPVKIGDFANYLLTQLHAFLLFRTLNMTIFRWSHM